MFLSQLLQIYLKYLNEGDPTREQMPSANRTKRSSQPYYKFRSILLCTRWLLSVSSRFGLQAPSEDLLTTLTNYEPNSLSSLRFLNNNLT